MHDPLSILADIFQPRRVMTTDEMDSTTPEERGRLVGFCEHCNAWYKFDRTTAPDTCPTCTGNYSTRIGFQLTSQRSFNEVAAKKKKLPKKK